jgi:Macrocin-O-methyltransferase (TylF)
MPSLENIAGEFTQRSDEEHDRDSELLALATSRIDSGTFGAQWNYHMSVFTKRQVVSRLLYQDFLYQKIVPVPGVILEFGVHWGATIATLINLRGIYEPYNHSRTIVGFDTFSGFPGIDAKDGGFSKSGDYSTSDGYEDELSRILTIHESFAPIAQIKKFDLIKGDVAETLPTFLEDNPHIVVAMAIFDMDIYAPTKSALERIIPRLTKGSLLVFDELNCRHFPGETQALDEVIGLNKLRLQRVPNQPFCAFAEFGA